MAKHVCVALLVVFAGGAATAKEVRQGLVAVIVRSEGEPVAGATVSAGTSSARTDDTGTVRLAIPEGVARVTVEMEGFFPFAHDVEVVTGETTIVDVELIEEPELEETVVVVATTRTGRRLDDQPTRVEVLGREEIEEKMLMTPGDIVMMLNEMGGMRVQATSPSIGAASVRVQGMKGRYTRFLSDGLPLFGQQVGGLGLLQIPPMDLGQVEVIKGVASALYGAGAMGGVVNLLSRRPGDERAVDLLFNQSTLGATDAVAFRVNAAGAGWGCSLLAGGHRQARTIATTMAGPTSPGYARGVVAAARLLGRTASGRSAFLTAA